MRSASRAGCLLGVLFVIGAAGAASALEMDRLKVQRKEVFEFTEKPTVTRAGDTITIAFTSKDFCDATVAIENAEGKIIRHLASGVLGKNAPLPFQKDSLKQTIVWDGKDEIGRYIDDKDNHTLRVSLGLKPQMERTLYWSGQRMSSGQSSVMRATPEGVYAYFPGQGDQLRLFDHSGNYLRTVYPFPAEKIEKVQGLKWQEFPPDNARLPSKLGTHNQDTFFPEDQSIRDIAVQGSRLCLVSSRVMTMATDGSGSGVDFVGSVMVAYEDKRGDPGSDALVRPHGAALSPDGKRLYLTGYTRAYGHGGYGQRQFYHGVNVVDLADGGKMTPFVGIMQGKDALGTDDAHFRCPLSVACDAQGRVYVADNFNSRIQVYLPDGKFYKSIPTPRPGIVRVHPRNGEIVVFTSRIFTGYGDREAMGVDKIPDAPSSVRFLGPVDDPKEKASYPLPPDTNEGRNMMFLLDANFEVDFHTDPPTIWQSTSPNNYIEPPNVHSAIRLWQPEGRKLVLKRNCAIDAQKSLAQPRSPHFGRPRLWVNPANEKLYLGQITWEVSFACKSFYDVVQIDPATGKNVLQHMPTNAEDMGFDWEGRAYLRGDSWIARFDSDTWREIPFDYGEQRIVCHSDGGAKPYKAISAVTLPSCIGGTFHMGGFGVAPDGTTVVSCINPNDPAAKKLMKEKNVTAKYGAAPYTPPIYPGRNGGWETHIFDVHGKVLKEDVAPGIDASNFLQIDRDNNVYVLAAGTPYIDGKPYFNGRGCTLFKVVPGKVKCLTPGGIIPLGEALRPNRPMDMTRPGIWVQGAEWLFGPVGADGHYGSGGKCDCYVNGRFAIDYFGRSFAPEVDRFRVVVLDTNGNVITRTGKYGNVDDGIPLVKPDPALADKQGSQPPTPRSIGGDEVAIMHCMNLGVQSDRRLFLADIGNQCIRSVKLGYHAEEKVALKSVPDL